MRGKATYVTENRGDFVARLESNESALHEGDWERALRCNPCKSVAINNTAWFEIIYNIWSFRNSKPVGRKSLGLLLERDSSATAVKLPIQLVGTFCRFRVSSSFPRPSAHPRTKSMYWRPPIPKSFLYGVIRYGITNRGSFSSLARSNPLSIFSCTPQQQASRCDSKVAFCTPDFGASK